MTGSSSGGSACAPEPAVPASPTRARGDRTRRRRRTGARRRRTGSAARPGGRGMTPMGAPRSSSRTSRRLTPSRIAMRPSGATASASGPRANPCPGASRPTSPCPAPHGSWTSTRPGEMRGSAAGRTVERRVRVLVVAGPAAPSATATDPAATAAAQAPTAITARRVRVFRRRVVTRPRVGAGDGRAGGRSSAGHVSVASGAWSPPSDRRWNDSEATAVDPADLCDLGRSLALGPGCSVCRARWSALLVHWVV